MIIDWESSPDLEEGFRTYTLWKKRYAIVNRYVLQNHFNLVCAFVK